MVDVAVTILLISISVLITAIAVFVIKETIEDNNER